MRSRFLALLLGACLCLFLGTAQLRADPPTGNPNDLIVTPPNLPPLPTTLQPLQFPQNEYYPVQRSWVNLEYLLWFLSGDRLPPLVTTGPPSSGGVLGQGGEVLYGNNAPGSNGRSGGRITAGYWLDQDQTWAVEGSFFMLQNQTDRFDLSSLGNPVVARPFYNTLLSRPDAEIVAFPGVSTGKIIVDTGSSNLLGAELLLRRNVCERCCCSGMYRLSVLGGFRFLDYSETLGVGESLTSVNPNSPVPLGTALTVGDHFATHNDFYGGEIGLGSQFYYKRWFLNLQGKLGIGATNQTVNIDGFTEIAVPGTAPILNQGGLLALGSNSGHHTTQAFSLVPELDFSLSYALTRRCSVNVGYTLMYWTNIARPGAEIDSAVNPNQLPPPIPGGDSHPLFSFQNSNLLAEGVSVGFLVRY